MDEINWNHTYYDDFDGNGEDHQELGADEADGADPVPTCAPIPGRRAVFP